MNPEPELFDDSSLDNSHVSLTPDPDHPADPIRGKQRVIRRRDFCITYFNVDKMPEVIERLNLYKDRIRYFVWQKERTPTTGRLHYQCYIECNTPQYINFIKECLFKDPGVHVQLRTGTDAREKCRNYCKKTYTRVEGPYEWGTWVQDGQRSDIDKIKIAIEDGASVGDVMETNFKTAVRIPHALKLYKQVQQRKEAMEEREVDVRVYYGPTGTGKTRAAMDEAKALCDGDVTKVYILSQPRQRGGALWFDGYEGGDVIIVDDYYDWISTTDLLRFTDRYPARFETKGGTIFANWKHVFITSNFHPLEWKDPQG
ncbi:MAG: hypothetical protein ACTSWQ_06435, partial [Candidatus Thorarchaeota archaeon]